MLLLKCQSWTKQLKVRFKIYEVFVLFNVYVTLYRVIVPSIFQQIEKCYYVSVKEKNQ